MQLNKWEIEICRRHLLDLTSYSKPNFSASWFHTLYYQKLNDFAKGKIKKLMVFVPPQHGKSEGSTRRLPAKLIGDNPNRKVAIASYSASKARKFNREIQRVIEDPIYRQVYPDVMLSNGADGYTKTFDEVEIVGYEGGIKTVGVGGPLTGDPVDVLIMDDLYKDWASAQSETIREGIQDWYDSVADTRLHNDSQQLIVFTRWHEMDLAGYLLSKEPEQWEVLVYSAIKEGEPTDYDPRNAGEALWPERHAIEKLVLARKRNAHNFETLYQQNPKPKEGLLFPLQDLRLFNPSQFDLFKMAEYKAGYEDPADTGGDSLSFVVGYLVGNLIYVVDIIYNTKGTDVNEPASVAMVKKHELNQLVIETNGGWVSFGNTVRRKAAIAWANCKTRLFPNTTSKHVRILAQSSFIVNNFVFREDWSTYSVDYCAFMKNLTSYRTIQEGSARNKHDDAPDSAAGLADIFFTRFKQLW